MKNIQRGLFLFVAFIGSHAYGQFWKQYADSASRSQEQRNPEIAIELYSKAATLLPIDSAFTITHAAINDSLGKLFINVQKYKVADSCYTQSLKIREKLFGNSSAEYAMSCYDLGYLNVLYLNKFQEAQSYLEKSKKIRELNPGKKSLEYAQTCHYLATVFSDIGKDEEALKLFLEAKEIKDQLFGKENLESAKTIANIGSIYLGKTHYSEAIVYYQQADEIFRKLLTKTHPYVIQITQAIATCYKNMSLYSQSLAILLDLQNVILSTSGKKSRSYQSNITLLGSVYRELGDYKKAEEFLLEIAKTHEEMYGTESPFYATDCWNLGALYSKLGQYKKAEQNFLKCKTIREKYEKNTMLYAAACESLAEVYIAKKEYEKVEALLLETKRTRESLGGNTFSDSQLGYFYLLTDQYDKALSVLIEGKKILERTQETNTEYYLSTIEGLAYTYLNTSQYNLAKELFLASKNLTENIYGNEHIKYAIAYKNLAEVDWKLGNNDSAYQNYITALTIQNNELKKVFQFTSEEEKQYYLQKVSDFQNSFLSFSMSSLSPAKQGLAYTTSFTNRNLTLESSQQLRTRIFELNDTTMENRYNKWIDIRKQLSVWYSKPKSQRPGNIKAIEEEAGILEKKIVNLLNTGSKRNINEELTWRSIQRKLLPDEAAIEFVEFPFYDAHRVTDSTYYIALLLRSEGAEPELITLFEKHQLDSILKQSSSTTLNEQLKFLYTYVDSNQKNPLYDLVWRPIDERLKGIKTVYFASAGSLYKIAFAALPVNATQMLSEKYRLVQLNTTASITNKETTTINESDQLTVYGGIEYDVDSSSMKQMAMQYGANDIATRSIPDDEFRNGIGPFRYLSGSEREINAIEDIAKQKKYNNVLVRSGIAATEESFKSMSGSNQLTVLHLATHGFFYPDIKGKTKDERLGGGFVFQQSHNPLIRSGLALAGANNAWLNKPVNGVEDGILTAYEISNMYFPKTKLVVLSACETGLGDIQGNEGVYGLQRAFKIAGVKNLVMSLWQVDDLAASEFMQEFYKNIFEKQDINSAFYQAQTVLKNKYRSDPYKWAAWIMVR
jgi:CHAT domain-containing protein